MKVLLVAPQSNLSLVHAEVQDILRSGLDVTPLIGDVTSTQLLREIRSGNYDVLWFATHGGEYEKATGQFTRDLKLTGTPQAQSETDYGVQLSDGMLSMSELTAIVRGRFRLVVLNTCDSYQIAQMLQVDANVSVICTMAAVPDKQAYQTGSNFASHLKETGSISEAYKLAIPGGNRIYLYLAALLPSQDSFESLVAEIRDLRVELVKSSKRLWWMVAGIVTAIAMNLMTWIWLFSRGV